MNHLHKILKKMCEVAGVDYKSVDFKDDFWFTEHTWTQQQEDAFKRWLIDYLNNNSEARKEILAFPNWKGQVEKAVNMFVFQYGWTTK